MTTRWLVRLGVLVAVATGLVALAQDGSGFNLSWVTIDSGGLTFGTGGSLELGGTAGQPDAGPVMTMSGGNYTLTGGFWVVAAPACSSFAAADFNRDCFVDTQDFAVFSACFTGPGVAYNPASPPTGCPLAASGGHLATDLNADGTIDQSDFALFQRCFSGPQMPADASCGR